MASEKDKHLRLDEKNHVEEPFLKQLEAMPDLCWKVLRLEMGNGQTPNQTGRTDFTQVIMFNELKESLKRINPQLNDQQITEAVHELTTFDGDNLFQNNQRILELLIKGTTVQKQTAAGLHREHIDFIDFQKPENNSFTAVSQFKIRIIGTDSHIYSDIICFVNGISIESQTKEFVSGESLLYLGKHYQLNIANEDFEGIIFDGKFIISKQKQVKANKMFKEWFQQKATEIIVPKAITIAKQIGVSFNKINILDLKYRWGSCTPKDKIHFNWRLIKAPMNVIENIIVHELTHLLEANHTPEFWNRVRTSLPQYTTAKRWLKNFGCELETEF